MIAEAEKRESIGQPLPELPRFSEPGVNPGDAMDIAVATTPHRIHLFTTRESAQAALAYREIVGKTADDFRISVVDAPIEQAMKLTNGELALTMYSAIDPELNIRMFKDGPAFGQLLMAHVYTPPENGHESPGLHCVGAPIASQNLLRETREVDKDTLLREMAIKRRDLMGGSLTNEDFREILRSPKVKRVIAHALGPEGTNIAQAMREYIAAIGLEDKTDIIVHNGPKPLEYADIARGQIEEGVVPIHMECAVYNNMRTLFEQRPDEVVFADHHNMFLDAMQTASRWSLDELSKMGKLTVTTHPSPKPLLGSWIDAGRAEWIEAVSNAAAAKHAAKGEMTLPDGRVVKVHACVTTGSALALSDGLQSLGVHGSPNMLFTVGTSLNEAQLQELR